MKNVQELSKVEFDKETNLYLVKILSSATGRWFIAGEWPTEKQAKDDQRMYMQ